MLGTVQMQKNQQRIQHQKANENLYQQKYYKNPINASQANITSQPNTGTFKSKFQQEQIRPQHENENLGLNQQADNTPRPNTTMGGPFNLPVKSRAKLHATDGQLYGLNRSDYAFVCGAELVNNCGTCSRVVNARGDKCYQHRNNDFKLKMPITSMRIRTPNPLKPVACTPVACTPVACKPVACTPVACKPKRVASTPVACTPVACKPVACTPVACKRTRVACTPVACKRKQVACTPVACKPKQVECKPKTPVKLKRAHAIKETIERTPKRGRR
jgi:hypothetical protein